MKKHCKNNNKNNKNERENTADSDKLNYYNKLITGNDFQPWQKDHGTTETRPTLKKGSRYSSHELASQLALFGTKDDFGGSEQIIWRRSFSRWLSLYYSSPMILNVDGICMFLIYLMYLYFISFYCIFRSQLLSEDPPYSNLVS